MSELVDKYKVIKFIEDYKENHNKEPQKYPINYGTLLDIMRWLYCMPTVEAVPLSVIEKIHTEVGNLEWYGDDAFWDGVNAVTTIIDKAVKECTHDKG